MSYSGLMKPRPSVGTWPCSCSCFLPMRDGTSPEGHATIVHLMRRAELGRPLTVETKGMAPTDEKGELMAAILLRERQLEEQ
jgi:hypothetical protein